MEQKLHSQNTDPGSTSPPPKARLRAGSPICRCRCKTSTPRPGPRRGAGDQKPRGRLYSVRYEHSLEMSSLSPCIIGNTQNGITQYATRLTDSHIVKISPRPEFHRSNTRPEILLDIDSPLSIFKDWQYRYEAHLEECTPRIHFPRVESAKYQISYCPGGVMG